MLYRRGYFVACILMLTLLLVSCSGGNSPTSPDLSPGLTAPRMADDTGNSRMLWGYWDIKVDTSSQAVEVIPLRNAMFNANMTQFLQPPMAPVNLLKINVNPTSDFTTGLIDVDVTLEHPFKALPMYRGFDVRGIFLADGSKPIVSVPGMQMAETGEAMVLNADGYTRWWNASEFGPEGSIFGYQLGKLGYPFYPTATVNPYKYFADELNETAGVEKLDPVNRGTFSTTLGTNTRNYVIQFVMDGPKPVFEFQYAVDAAWETPDPTFAPDYPIEAFPPEAQMREAYHLQVTDLGSNAWYETPTEFGGEFVLGIEVFDWQTPEDPVSDQLGALYIESPMFGGSVDVLPTALESMGSVNTSRIYSVVLGDLDLTQNGDVEILIVVESAQGTYMPNLDGGEAFTYPDAPLASYFKATVHILGESPNNPPVADASLSVPLVGYSPLSVNLDGSASYDPDPGDSIQLYEWDIDNDGTYDYSYPDATVFDHEFVDVGIHLVQLRVTDVFGDWDVLDEPLEVEVLAGEDSWPISHYDVNNTSYNPYSYVTYPLSEVFSIDHPFNSHSMLIVNSDNIFLTDPSDKLRALDVNSGAQVWEKTIKTTSGGYWTGCASALWGDDVIIGGTGIHSYDLPTQGENWHVYPTTGFEHQGQVVLGDTIFFKGSLNTMVSIDANDGSENWSVPWTAQPLFPPVYGEVSGQGYVAAPYGSSVRCVNADTGAEVWTQSIGGSCFHNPMVIGEYAYFGYYNVYKKHLATGDVDAAVNLINYAPLGMWKGPEDEIYASARNHTPDPDEFKLYRFDSDLNEEWSVDVGFNCDFGTYSGGVIWLAERIGSDTQIRAFDPEDGEVLYTHPTLFNYAWGGITNVDNKLFFCDNYGQLICLETE